MLLNRLVLLALWPAFVAVADEAPGHSLHGDAFNEGPRQAAVLMAGMPKIDFPITTQSAEAQKFFTQGVAQQHGFWYFEAERSHRQASALDPDAAMPFWGMALANVNNEKRAKGFLAKAVERKAKASKREQLWITSLENFYKDDKRDKKARQQGYIKDLETLVQDYPEDIEAKAFLAWKIWDARGDLPISSNQALDALLDQIFAVNPMHPAHHYRIHLWDDNKPARALKSGALCGQTSPRIAHMWHMPGHTFSKLNRPDDAAWQQEASTRVDHAYMMKSLVLPDQIHNYAHNEEWLIRTWNDLGRARDGISLAKALIENPRHPSYNTLDKERSSASYGRTRLIETLTKWELWGDLLNLNGGPLLEPTVQTGHEVTRLRAVGIAQYATGKSAELAVTIAALEALEKKEKSKAAVKEEVRKAETAKKESKAVAAAPTPEAKKPDAKKAEDKNKGLVEGLAELRALKLILSKANPVDIKSALEKAKDTPKPRLVRYWLDIDQAKAVVLAADLPQDIEGSLLQARVYQVAGKLDDAKKSFERVREKAFALDGELPAAKQAEALAAVLGMKDGWRKPAPVRQDSGTRPSLDSLGPVHWSPTSAPAWAGNGMDGKVVSNKDYTGKPTLLIFYVGHHCTHCMEQLRAFEPLAAEFTKQGINIVALSPDSVEDLPKANKWSKTKGGFPMKLVSADVATFRNYRAHDDFEQFPLHAVALVDAQQRLRWLDVSYQPFQDVKFLIDESKRLLALPQIEKVATR